VSASTSPPPTRGRRSRAHGLLGHLAHADDPPPNPPTHAPELARLERATAALEPPFAIVDLDALWANAADMERRARPKPIRLASKSLRCRSLQERVLDRPGFHGTLAYTLPEALWLAHHGAQDILVAYPTTDRYALRALAALTAERPETRIAIMVDCIEHLDLLDRATDGSPGIDRDPGAPADLDQAPGGSTGLDHAPLRVCLELDAGLWALGGRLRIGAKRSPLHTPAQLAALARAIRARPGLQLVGIMAYESQIAGLGDAPPGNHARALAIRLLQALSARELSARRALAVAAVQEVLAGSEHHLELVNGGGTGSLHLTAREPSITEIAAGSGLYGPTLFDAYRAFQPRPAAMFALPIVRRPAPGIATALGGGYLASGPADKARLPSPHLPAGLRLDRQEGAGEVQTPLLGPPADTLAVGDRVWMRHTKAGELCERFPSLHLIEGDHIVDEVPTYRGEGQCFL
jgi:D-serine deaminase-like pyridoxal phosphate-dependent protein